MWITLLLIWLSRAWKSHNALRWPLASLCCLEIGEIIYVLGFCCLCQHYQSVASLDWSQLETSPHTFALPMDRNMVIQALARILLGKRYLCNRNNRYFLSLIGASFHPIQSASLSAIDAKLSIRCLFQSLLDLSALLEATQAKIIRMEGITHIIVIRLQWYSFNSTSKIAIIVL